MGMRRPNMIAMKGHPCTGKSSLAKVLAEALRCPIISQDDIRDAYQPPPQSINPNTAATDLHSHSFDIMCRIAWRQCQLHLPNFIIDSSISCRADLDQLLRISALTGASLVVLECKPQDKYERQQWAETRGKYPWYKPCKWDDIEKLDDKSEDYDTGLVSKVVINTSRRIKMVDLIYLVDRLGASFPTIDSISDYHDWVIKLGKGLIEHDGVPEEKGIRRRHNHDLHFIPEDQLKEGKVCRVCQQTITPDSSAYGCPRCDLSVHKSCAELLHNKDIKPQDYPKFLLDICHDMYSFREEVKCNHCESYETREHGSCQECLLESYIRSAELPSVVQHPFHQHFLQVVIRPISYDSVFKCEACGDPGKHVRYCCNECRLDYHLTCCLLPHSGKETHHRHDLTMTNFVKDYELDEQFICNACEGYRNPKCWIYHCNEGCHFACHLKCMTFDV